MKLTWMKWSALPGCRAVGRRRGNAQDQPAPSSQPAAASAERKLRDGGNASNDGDASGKPKPPVAQRKENQQDRIATGREEWPN